MRQGKDVLLTVDVQGAATIRDASWNRPGIEEGWSRYFSRRRRSTSSKKRLEKRGTDTAAVIQKRLSVARQEIAQWKNFDYLVISTTIAEDLRRVQSIVEAEKMRALRSLAPEL